MKNLNIVLLLLFVNFLSAQSGKIYPKNNIISYGKENIYVYEPSTDRILPMNSLAVIVHKNYQKKSFPLIRKGNNYEFTMKLPDSISVFMLIISDIDNNIIDNNSNKGYVVYLKHGNKEEFYKSKLSYLQQWNTANYFLKLKITPEETITQFEEIYKENSTLKEGDSYTKYLFLKYNIDKESIKQEMIVYANKLALKNDEINLLSASEIFGLYNLKNEQEEIEKLIIKKFPKGNLAKRKSFQQFYLIKDKTEQTVLNALKNYSEEFNDYTTETKNKFYTVILEIYLKNRDIINLKKYENLVTNKINMASLYYSRAWTLSGQDLTSSGEDLEFAEQISKTALDLIEIRIEKPSPNDDKNEVKEVYNMYLEIYALILYKQKKYDKAFINIEKCEGLDTGGKEIYAAIAEKVKGPEFSKFYLEKELLAGVDSKIMLIQLEKIYRTLKFPLNGFENIKSKSLKLTSQKLEEKIIKMYGNIKAMDFTLTNIAGDSIRLSDYEGKIIILDFWATWCLPCRASFPKMQELVSKYKNHDVQFFFIDTWERNTVFKTKESVKKLLKENNYSFNVLFDFEEEIASMYKIKGLPTRIIIDKKGNIISIDSSESNLVALIEENIR